MNRLEKHDRVLTYINEYIKRVGYPPSIREICESLNFSSTSVVDYQLKGLEERGLITRTPGVARGIVVIPYNPTMVQKEVVCI